MRKCPSCNMELKEMQYHKQTVDMCPTCGGVFFDHGELETIVQIVDIFKDIELSEEEIDTVSRYEKERILLCPECNVELCAKEIAGEIIDVCPECRGIWLDKGEIIALKIAENHIKEYLNLYIRLAE
ncbi:MAG: zf-TFIIB domain-containing protein [Spirochaetales bacterium]|nr:zf-TFIIB domain-containing protein [Spirochaetales bacterium]